MVIWKFIPNVPSTKTSAMTSMTSGGSARRRRPSRICPLPRARGAGRELADAQASRDGEDERRTRAPLTQQRPAGPQGGDDQAGHRGPMSRPALNDALLRATALAQPVLGDHLGDEGLARRVVDGGRDALEEGDERRRATARRTPVRVSDGEDQRGQAEQRSGCVSRMCRLRNRSAIIPVDRREQRNGRNCSPVTMPSAVDEWSVSTVRTSQSWPTRPIQVPTLETSAPEA